jgi:pimeloyl-ACP methyl ester carboxylesterase
MLFTYYAYAFLDARTPEHKAIKHFKKKGLELVIHRTSFEDKAVKHVEVRSSHDTEVPLIIFVHGTPGSSDNFFDYMTDSALVAGARMVSIDRLGYGDSDYGTAHTSIEVQARQIKHVADQYEYDRLILVGHSYGGPIIARFAMDYPDAARAIFMLAPVVDPDNEKIFWFSPVGKWKLTRWMLPGALQVSGDEKYSHEAELRLMKDKWSSIQAQVIHMHGKQDELAPYVNLTFVKKQMEGMDNLKVIDLEDANHFLPWNQFERIRTELLSLL